MHPLNDASNRRARVGICIATFRRRELLRQLLVGMSRLTFERMRTPDILVVVVDNDAARSAADVCDSVALPWPAKYVVEPRRGIAQARNRAIREAEDPDFLVFLDDDEVPTPLVARRIALDPGMFRWRCCLRARLATFCLRRPGMGEAPGDFSASTVFTTGHPSRSCCTGNVLISRKVITAVLRALTNNLA